MIEKIRNWKKVSCKGITNNHSDSHRKRALYIQICDKLLSYSQGNRYFLFIKTQTSIEIVFLHVGLIPFSVFA